MAIDFPWQMFADAAQRKQQKQQQDMQYVQGIGQTINDASKQYADQAVQERQKAQWSKTINSMMMDPNTSPQMKQILPLIAQHPEYSGQLLPPALKQKQPGQSMEIGPDGTITIGGMPVPGQTPPVPQSSQPPTAVPNAPPLPPGNGSAITPPVGGAMPPQPPPRKSLNIPLTGNKAADLMVKGLGNKPTVQQDLRKQFIDAMNRRTEVQSRTLNAHQINTLAKATGLQPTVVKGLQQNNVRADRALAIADDPRATWSALNGWINTDFAGIMQGGAPQKEQLLDTKFPNWRAQISQIKTYFGSQPEGPIPPGFRDYMKHFVRGIKEIDNDYLWKSAQFQGEMIGPTIQGGAPFVKKSQDFTKSFMQGGKPLGGGTTDYSNMSTEELQRIAAGGQ